MGKGFRLGLPQYVRDDTPCVRFDEACPHEGSEIAVSLLLTDYQPARCAELYRTLLDSSSARVFPYVQTLLFTENTLH